MWRGGQGTELRDVEGRAGNRLNGNHTGGESMKKRGGASWRQQSSEDTQGSSVCPVQTRGSLQSTAGVEQGHWRVTEQSNRESPLGPIASQKQGR